MTVRPRRAVTGFALLLLVPFAGVHAEPSATAAEAAARITVSGTGEAASPAARATLSIGIQTQGATAAAAGANGARIAGAVAASLRAAGLPPADLKSSHLMINPQWTYDDQTHQQRRTGFQADTTFILNTVLLGRLGNWVDAALDAGATTVSDPAFAPADEAALRHLALSHAVQNARGDAEVLAAATGGSLGALLQISQGEGTGMGMPMGAMAVTTTSRRVPLAVPTNIVPDEIRVTATVTAMWRYIAGPTVPGH